MKSTIEYLWRCMSVDELPFRLSVYEQFICRLETSLFGLNSVQTLQYWERPFSVYFKSLVMSIELMTLFPFLNYPTNLSIIPTTIEPSEFLLDHADKTHWKKPGPSCLQCIYTWFCLASTWSFFKELNLNTYCTVVNIFDIYRPIQ